MEANSSDKHLFGGRLGRAAFSVYFLLGAVVPLAGLGWVVVRFALPGLDDRATEVSLLVGVGFVALLSLGAFLTLRTMTRSVIGRMDRDNERLDRLLRCSSELAAVQHLGDAFASAVDGARALAEAETAYLFLKGDEEDGPSLVAHSGDGAEARYAAEARALDEFVASCVGSRRPALRGAEGGEAPAAAVPLPAEADASGAVVVLRSGPEFGPDEVDALATLCGLSAVALHNADLRDSQRNFFSHVTDILVTTLDSHLNFHQGHGRRVAQLVNRLGRALHLDDEAMQRLHFAGLLHDIGMLKIDRDQQMSAAACDKHCVLGYRMLTRIRLWKDIAPIVYHHHEWFDGSGYPEGRSGEEIPRESRIIALCDAVDSMTARSSYRDPLDLDEALAELERCSGTQFDPEIVDAFVRLARESRDAVESVLEGP